MVSDASASEQLIFHVPSSKAVRTVIFFYKTVHWWGWDCCGAHAQHPLLIDERLVWGVCYSSGSAQLVAAFLFAGWAIFPPSAVASAKRLWAKSPSLTASWRVCATTAGSGIQHPASLMAFIVFSTLSLSTTWKPLVQISVLMIRSKRTCRCASSQSCAALAAQCQWHGVQKGTHTMAPVSLEDI